MEWLETAVVIVHIIVCLGLIGLVMIQQGKGAEAGASFGGGASQTVFGSQGSGSFLTKATKYFAIVFFVTSISLAVIAKQKSEVAAEGVIAPAPAQVEAVQSLEESAVNADSAESEVNIDADGASVEEQAAPELE